MKNNVLKFINLVLNGFQEKRGKASLYCFTNNIIPQIAVETVKAFRNKHTDEKVLIIAPMEYRKNIQLELHAANIYVGVTIMTENFIISKYAYKYPLTILIGVNDNLPIIQKLTRESKFTLCILTKNIMDKVFIGGVRNILPDINTHGLENSIAEDRINSPVEERRVAVQLPDDETSKLYEDYSKYITDTITILKDIETITNCKRGDFKNNKSAIECCTDVAKANGWDTKLDITNPIMKEIDELYNPINIASRAEYFFNISKCRRELLFNNKNKLQAIYDIINKHRGSKILIVSKTDAFASIVTDYLNACAKTPKDYICLNYHDNLEKIPAVDENGKAIAVKSGKNKGELKMLGTQAQCTQAELRFNNNEVNILSIKDTSQDNLKVECDVIIFTTPLCANIVQFRQRFVNVTFNTNPLITYKIYTSNTVEEVKLNSNINGCRIEIVEEEKDIIFDNSTNTVII